MLLRNQKPNYIYSRDVENWQRDLSTVGYAIAIDGLFGDETERVTRDFQREIGARVDGIVGNETRGAMSVLLNPRNQISRRGSRSNIVRWIQNRYRARGYRLQVDGIFGPETEMITREFQKDMGIAADGIVGPITMSRLMNRSTGNGGQRKIRVFIDNGHGPGNGNGGGGYLEWEGNLKSARYLRDILEATDKFETMLTYDWSPQAGVRQRGNRAANWGARLLFSIHSNAGGGSGPECYYSINIPSDRQYAAMLTEKIATEFNLPNRGAKTRESGSRPGRDFMGVIDSAQSGGVDHVLLIESMFHDHRNDRSLLLKDETHRKLAQIYADIIFKVFQ